MERVSQTGPKELLDFFGLFVKIMQADNYPNLNRTLPEYFCLISRFKYSKDKPVSQSERLLLLVRVRPRQPRLGLSPLACGSHSMYINTADPDHASCFFFLSFFVRRLVSFDATSC